MNAVNTVSLSDHCLSMAPTTGGAAAAATALAKSGQHMMAAAAAAAGRLGRPLFCKNAAQAAQAGMLGMLVKLNLVSSKFECWGWTRGWGMGTMHAREAESGEPALNVCVRLETHSFRTKHKPEPRRSALCSQLCFHVTCRDSSELFARRARWRCSPAASRAPCHLTSPAP